MNQVKYLSVGELNQLLNASLERQFPHVYVEGEIAECSKPASGHIYFTLKDSRAQISAVMWKGAVASLTFIPNPGVAVQCIARPNVYGVNGRLQMIVNRMVPAGEGELRRKFLELKSRLENEGLFNTERKRAIPFLPRAIGVVTSASGAVIHDIMVKIRERMNSLQVYLIDVKVQGDGAAREIARAVEQFSSSGLVDVIIVARGGGSLEDLWAFNEEVVVRAIFASKVPVVSGVGHEVDVTLSDLVADERAPTPTAAAERVVPRRDVLSKQIDELARRLADTNRWLMPQWQRLDETFARLNSIVQFQLERTTFRLSTLEHKLQLIRPDHLIRRMVDRVARLGEALMTALGTKVHLSGERLAAQIRRFERSAMEPGWKRYDERMDNLGRRLAGALDKKLMRQRSQLETASARLEAASPKRILDRGYSIIEHHGEIITSSRQLTLNEDIRLIMADGRASARITATE